MFFFQINKVSEKYTCIIIHDFLGGCLIRSPNLHVYLYMAFLQIKQLNFLKKHMYTYTWFFLRFAIAIVNIETATAIIESATSAIMLASVIALRPWQSHMYK